MIDSTTTRTDMYDELTIVMRKDDYNKLKKDVNSVVCKLRQRDRKIAHMKNEHRIELERKDDIINKQSRMLKRALDFASSIDKVNELQEFMDERSIY